MSNTAHIIHELTGIELVDVPAGPFLFGAREDDATADADEKPQRTMDLPGYRIGRGPVTNAQYKRFIDANPDHPTPFFDDWVSLADNWDKEARTYPAGKDDHPVVLLRWHDAKAFCDWAGLALPTEAQWEKAARGTDGRVYPWGDVWIDGRANTREDGHSATTPVGLYSPQGDSPYGCMDVVGNCLEWVDGWYDAAATVRVLRSSPWYFMGSHARITYREYHQPDGRGTIGFRVVAIE